MFRRINSTKYSLNEIEVNNAVYAGELMRLASGFAEHDFFDNNKVFRATDIKRMGDVKFVLQLIITMISGYFNRDELFEEYLSKFNDQFPDRDEIAARLSKLFSYVEDCGFGSRSRFWKRSDLFTALVEIDRLICDAGTTVPTPTITFERLNNFYSEVDSRGLDAREVAVQVYAKASIQASNDRLNRARRGAVIHSVLLGQDASAALQALGLAD